MKNILFVRIPSTCICFTVIVLGNIGLNLLWGDNSFSVLLVLFLWLIVCQLIDVLISKIEFRKWSHYFVVESIILYLLSLLFFHVFIWDDKNIARFLSFTAIFLITDVFVFWYFRKRQEIQAEEINQLIRAREKL